MAQKMKLIGKTVLITGAGSGIGRLMAMGAAKRGAAAIVLWDLDADSLDTVAHAITTLGSTPHPFTVDVSDRKAVIAAAQKVLASCGPVDVLVNNAGVVSGKKFLDLSEANITKTYAVNALALYWTIQAFLPSMLERDSGRLVTIASAGGLAGSATLTDYSGSKFAAVGFTESLRAELRDAASSVSTLTVFPFYINTGMFNGVKSGSPLLPIQDPDSSTERILDAIESTKPELLMPAMVYSVRLFRLFPARVFDFLADAFGINKAMKTFRGRQAPQSS